MPKRRVEMPSEPQIPAGPRRDLVEWIHDVYRRGGRPTQGAISNRTRTNIELDAFINKNRVGWILNGHQKGLASWDHIHALISVLSSDEEDLAKAKQLWAAYIEAVDDGAPTEWSELPPVVRAEQDVRSLHFALIALNQWQPAAATTDIPTSRRSARRAGAETSAAGHIRGVFSMMAAQFDANTAGRTIYTPTFQWIVKQQVEWGLLRGSKRVYNTQVAYTPTSFITYGNLPFKRTEDDQNRTHAFIAIEAHDRGVVTVYFSEPCRRPLVEVLAWWICGAAQTAFYTHNVMGSSGLADATLILDPRGITDCPSKMSEMGSAMDRLHEGWGADLFANHFRAQSLMPTPVDGLSGQRSNVYAWRLVNEMKAKWQEELPWAESLTHDVTQVRKWMEWVRTVGGQDPAATDYHDYGRGSPAP